METPMDEATRWVVIAMIVADGEIVTSEISRATHIVQRVTGASIDETMIAEEASSALENRLPVGDVLRRIGPSLNDHSKELLIRIAVDIAATDGELAAGEIALVRRVAQDLDFSADDLRGIIAPGE